MYARIAVESLEEMSDADLIRLCKTGNERALNVLLDRHRDSLYRFCLHLVSNREDAEDICQETLARAITQVDTLRSGAAFRTWLFRIARNLSVDSFRNQRRLCPLPEDEIIPLPLRADSPHEDVEHVEERETVVKALGELAESHQRVLGLRAVEGTSSADIAQQLNVSHSAVETLLFRARRRLREEYSKHAVPGIAMLGGLRDLFLRLPATAPEAPTAAKVALTAALVGGTMVTSPHWAPAVGHLVAPQPRHAAAPVHNTTHRRPAPHRATVSVQSVRPSAQPSAPSAPVNAAAPATGATSQHETIVAPRPPRTHAARVTRQHAVRSRSRQTHSRVVSPISPSSQPARATSRLHYRPVSSPAQPSSVTTVPRTQAPTVGASSAPAPAPAPGQVGRGTPPASSVQPPAPTRGSGAQHGNPSPSAPRPSSPTQQVPAPAAPSPGNGEGNGQGQGHGQATAPGQVGKSSPPGQTGGNPNAPGQGAGNASPPEQQPSTQPVAGTQYPPSGQGQSQGSGNGEGNGQGNGEGNGRGSGQGSGSAGTAATIQSPSPSQPTSQPSHGQPGGQSGNQGHSSHP